MSGNDQSDGPQAPSRRDVLRWGALASLSAGIAAGSRAAPAQDDQAVAKDGVAPPKAASEPGVHGPGAVRVRFTVNGKAQALVVEPRLTLAHALRHELSLTGTKVVCDRGTCGACTVLVDGKPAYSCSVLAVSADGRDIRTVEGFGTPEALSPVQAAFVANDALQCGACTPGFVVACHALLAGTPRPTDAEADAGLSGNLCRCGTHAGMRKAVHAAAAALAAPAIMEGGRRG